MTVIYIIAVIIATPLVLLYALHILVRARKAWRMSGLMSVVREIERRQRAGEPCDNLITFQQSEAERYHLVEALSAWNAQRQRP